MGYLFAKNVVQQSLRLELAKSYASSHFSLLEALQTVEKKCSALIQSFLPRSKHDVENEVEVVLIENDSHRQLRASMTGFALTSKDNYFGIRFNVNLNRLNVDHDFLFQLSKAYQIEYEIRNVMNFEFKRPKWSKRVAFTDSSNRR